MAKLIFPPSPSDNQLFTADNGVTYRYSSAKQVWLDSGRFFGGQLVFPRNPSNNQTFSATNGANYIYRSNPGVWLISSVTSAISTPSIVSPSDGSQNQGTAAGVTIISSTYQSSSGVGGHFSSSWELYKSIPVTFTTNVTNVSTSTVPPNYTATNVTVSGNCSGWPQGNNNVKLVFSPPISSTTITSGPINTGNGLTLKNSSGQSIGSIDPFNLTKTVSGLASVESFYWGVAGATVQICFTNFSANPGSSTVTLTVNNSTGWLSNVTPGTLIRGSAGQTLSVASVNVGASSVTSTSNGFSGSWTVGTIASVTGPAVTTPPTTEPPDPTKYTLITSLTDSTSSLTSWTVPKPPLVSQTNCFVRVRYKSVAPSFLSLWSPWSGFKTGNL